MQPVAPERAAFVSGLRAELAGFRELRQILTAEQDCLLRADVEGLLKLAETKSHQIDRLNTLATDRAAYLASLHLDPDHRGMTQWLSTQAGADAAGLASLWRQLLDAASQARELNERNGALIGARVSHNQAALATLRSAARSLTIYGPDGQPDLRTGGRELGRA